MTRQDKQLGLASLFWIASLADCVAQSPTGTITGVVRDPAGAVISNAKIATFQPATGWKRELFSGKEGDFSVPALAIGSYEVSAETPGFQKLTREALVEAGSTTTVDFNMIVGDFTQSITVDGALPQIRYPLRPVIPTFFVEPGLPTSANGAQ